MTPRPLLRALTPAELPAARKHTLEAHTLAQADAIVSDVKARGEAALREHAHRLGDLPDRHAPCVLGPDALQAARASLPTAQIALLERTAARIRTFAQAQREAITDLDIAVPGGRAGHHVVPVERAGCYAPGGRYPLPSSVLMTAITARAAGVCEVWVASPHPEPITLAAAAIAGADALLCVGGAQAIAAFAYGAGPVPAVDVIVGPGNRYVTAAKQLVSGVVGIDMLAGPSELVILADKTADPHVVASDLLGQAEHDPDARPILVSTSRTLYEAVEAELNAQLSTLPTATIAIQALTQGGFAVLCDDLDQAHAACDAIAPEHLEVHTADPNASVSKLKHFGGLFLGRASAEVFGDYGVGPNHVLPTGATARFTGGLSVLHFLRMRTWLSMDESPEQQAIVGDTATFARLEGLEAHARSALTRRRVLDSGD